MRCLTFDDPNPVKFIYLVGFALLVIFSYGIDGLWRRYMNRSGARIAPPWAGLKVWWTKAGKFEKNWIRGCGLVLGISLLAWLEYDSEQQTLADYLRTVLFTSADAEAIASFSVRQVGWFVLFLVLSTGLIAYIFSGAFSGNRSRYGGIALGLLLVADLGRADLPWVVYLELPGKICRQSNH